MKTMKKFAALFALLFVLLALSVPALAANSEDASAPDAAAQETMSEADVTSNKAMAAGVMIGVACLGGALGMGISISRTTEAIARQPEAAGPMMGLVFIETVIIYALIVAILIIFVL